MSKQPSITTDQLVKAAIKITVVAAVGLTALSLIGTIGGKLPIATDSDYVSFLTAGKLVDMGKGDATQLYNAANQLAIQNALHPGFQFVTGLRPYANPPFLAWFIIPFVNLNLLHGYFLWILIQTAILVIAAWLMRPLLPIRYRYLIILVIVGWSPLYSSTALGQISPLILLSIVLLWRGLRHGTPGSTFMGGIGLGLCLVKPQLLLIWIAYLLLKRAWMALAGLSIAAMLAWIASALLAGPDWLEPYVKWLSWFNSDADPGGYLPLMMVNILGLLKRLDVLNNVTLIITTSLMLALAFYGWWQSENGNPSPIEGDDRLALQISALSVLMPLTSPHTYSHDLMTADFAICTLLGLAAKSKFSPALILIIIAVEVTQFLYSFADQIPGIDIPFIAAIISFYLYVLWVQTGHGCSSSPPSPALSSPVETIARPS